MITIEERSQKEEERNRPAVQEKPSMSSVADTILGQLAVWDVRHIYGIAGDAIIDLMDAIAKQSALRYIGVRHESAAGFMASAEGKLTGRLGVCIGTSGPGIANMINGIADAAKDQVPLLVITGQVESQKVGTHAKQYVEQQQLMAPLSVYTASLLHPEATVDVIQRAILEALTKRGVAHVSVPKDLFAQRCSQEVRPPKGMLKHQKVENMRQFNDAIQRLSDSQRPVIYIGGGGRQSSSAIIHLAEKLGAAIIETLGAKGVVPYNHPLNLGGIGKGGTEESSRLLKEADCVLAIGANWWPKGFVPSDTQVVMIDISAASIESHPNTVCGLLGDAADLVPLLLESLPKRNRDSWQEQVQQAKAEITLGMEKERRGTGAKITPQRLIAALDETVQEDAIIAVDTGDHTLWFNRVFRATRQKVLFSGKWRTMGFGLPAAVSAKLSSPHKQVLALVGDGSFAMTMMELSTLVKYDLPVVVVVANNQALAAEKSKMKSSGLQPFGTELVNPDFAALARSFGIHGVRVDRENELNPVLQQMLAAGQSAVIDVMITDDMPPLSV
jgi:pyruvate oxidase